ncbi:MAG: Rne/Rng family ribonuclease [Deltaproteobacteria bacterium]|nr:Rne/Rng family ribonuclease [Deltaproteobacteria bacterium]
MSKEILINATPQETRIALVQDKRVSEFFFERNADKGIIGNIYKGKVVRVLPGMQAAFVDIGHERAAFLYAGDFHKSKHNVEDLDLDEEENLENNENRRRRRGYEPVPPIAELVREGQEILVQVAKGPIGTKGARLTCHISLPGRNLVFMPTLKHNGVSRKIESYDLRKRLKKIIDNYRTKEGGFIVRTAASSGINERHIKSDVDYLLNLWKKIGRKFQSSSAPQLLHYDLDLTTRVIRDFLDDDIEKLIVDSRFEHRRLLRFIRNFNPALRDKVELYQDDTPLFDRYNIEQEIHRILSKRVWLKSGGYLIIETTEALTSIDVNTGRFVGKKTLEETILKTNIEAAEEIVKQLRLRNIGGIIIIDFIDMERDSSKEQVYRFLENLLREDKSKTTILRISNLGLVEMTRKRSRESVLRYMTEQCPTCEGRGFIKSRVAVAHQVLRDIRRELPTLQEDHVYVTMHPDVYALLKSYENENLVAMEKQFQKGIRLVADPNFHLEQVSLVSGDLPKGKVAPLPPLVSPKKVARVEEDDEDDLKEYEADVAAIKSNREAKQREIEEIAARAAAEMARAEADELPDAEDAPDLEIEAPVIRSKEEAEKKETSWEAEDADVDVDGEDEDSTAQSTNPDDQSQTKIG